MSNEPTRPGARLTIAEVAFIVNLFPWPTPYEPVAISWAESQGNTNAYRPEAMNPKGGDDRGLVQWNSKAWPLITNDIAYHPLRALAAMFQISKDGTNFWPWYNSLQYIDSDDRQMAANALAASVNPYWKLIDANIDLYVPGMPVVPKPLQTPYISTLPAAPMKIGGYPDGRANALQRALAEEGVYPFGFDNWYGNKTKAALILLKERLRTYGVNIDVNGEYTEYTREVWDGFRRWSHEKSGR